MNGTVAPAAVLETARLRLRSFRLDDAASVQRQLSDREVADTTAAIPHPYPRGAAAEWIAAASTREACGQARVLAVTRRDDGLLVGCAELRIGRGGHRGELGYWIGRAHWNRGYATEAAGALVGWAFDTLGLHRVHAAHLTRNAASGRVLSRIGMRHEGTLRRHVLRWEILEDLELYGLLRADPRGSRRDGESR